jgi:pimeloyl-ACP methyl ester carboxylesterase
MRPFRIEIPEADLTDLRRRIAATRWPGELPGQGWQRGTPLAYTRELTGYWQDEYDWRAAEQQLNALPQFITEIDGVDVHFAHVRSPEPDAVPLIMTHGWPGTFADFLAVAGPLTDPAAHGGDRADAFHLVLPSLPGFGFSGPAREPGWDVRRVARAWAELMRRLGYDRYVAQGGDWGAPVSMHLAQHDPSHVLGLHLNSLVTFPPDDPAAFAGLGPLDQDRLAFMAAFEQDGAGFRHIQSTRPQSLAYGLTDSPVGQLAWIAEKYFEWTDSATAPEDAIDRDHLLTTVMIYWLTGTASSSAQLYYESNRPAETFRRSWGGPWQLPMPVAVASFPACPIRPIRAFAEQMLPTITRWTEFERGGHFPALEKPAQLTGDIREFVRSLRSAAGTAVTGRAARARG